MRPAVTLTIRKRSTGYKVAALAVDSLEHAWTIANLLVRSPEYSRCFVVGTNWTGDEIFTVGFSPAPAYSPHSYAAPTNAPSLRQSSSPPAHAYTRDAYAAEVVDAETSRYGFRLPPRRG